MSMKLLVISITVMCVLITVIDITMKLPAMFDQNPHHTLDEIVGEQKGVHA